MKLFKNAIITLKVASCEVCPHKTAQRHKTAKGFSTCRVCAAITRRSIHKITPGNPLGEYNPPISEARFHGAFLEDCPLEEA